MIILTFLHLHLFFYIFLRHHWSMGGKQLAFGI